MAVESGRACCAYGSLETESFQTENRMTTALDTRLGVFQPPDHGWGPVQTAVAASKKPECRTNPEFLLITSRMFIRTP